MAETEQKDVFAPGQAVGGYRILRRLGKGGMAEVYEVESEKTGSPYALKVFVCEQANAIFLKKRFLAEGRLLAKLHHPRIVRVYDFGFEGPEETPYYVMDLVLDGEGRPRTLRDMLSDGAADEARIAGWYGDLVEALAYIHGKGIVHRDVSLENVLVGPDGRVVLSDFGVSKVIARDLRAELNLSLVTQITDGRPLMGKAFYMAPEVRAGGEETFASDLYALGVLVFFMLNQVWYTPGPRVADLLAPFDDQWQNILPALLTEDPAARRCLPWTDPCERENTELREECERENAELREECGRLKAEMLTRSRRRWLRRMLWGGVLGGAIGAMLAFAVRYGGELGETGMETFRGKMVGEAKSLCRMPLVVLNNEPLDRETCGLIERLAVGEVADMLVRRHRGQTVDVGVQMERNANLYGELDEGNSDGVLAYQLICCQVAFRSRLHEGQAGRAAEILNRIRDVDDVWADVLEKEAEAQLSGDQARLNEFREKVKEGKEE